MEWLDVSESEADEQSFDAYMEESNNVSPTTELVGLLQPATIQYPPLQSETPLRFFIEPSTYINLGSLFCSVYEQSVRSQNITLPSSMNIQLPTSRPALGLPIQQNHPSPPSTMPVRFPTSRLPFVFPLQDEANDNTTHMATQRTMVMSNTSGAVSNILIQNMFIQNINVQTEDRRETGPQHGMEHEEPSFSPAFTAQRKFGFTKTVTVENDKKKISTYVNVTVANDAIEERTHQYLDGIRGISSEI